MIGHAPVMRFASRGNSAEADADDTLNCDLCPHRCRIPENGCGICKVRFNSESTNLPFYGHVTSLALDPIEKKPLFHFRPGSRILSAGFAGCNMHCPFCQNWQISQDTRAPGRQIEAAALVAMAKESGQIAYTYSEPLVHIEFLLDCMRQARLEGIANVLVTNGCINHEAAEEVLNLTDAANIDLKCFSRETYSQILGGDLDTVLEFIKTAWKKNVHIEITTLVVPGLNDSRQELDAIADFIAQGNSGRGKSGTPWHLSACHPDWKWNGPGTKASQLYAIAKAARNRLAHVYTGNIAGEENNTYCENCGSTLIRRRGYNIDTAGLYISGKNGAYFCAACKSGTPILAEWYKQSAL